MSLLRTASRVAVASSVHGRVQRRQAQRWSTPTQTAPAAPPAAPAPPPPVAAGGMTAERIALLTQLGDLRSAGVLTDAEFEIQKARLLS